jgi:purine nucleosidase
MGNNNFPEEIQESDVLDVCAVDKLIAMSHAAEEAHALLTMVFLGPLTNLAHAINKDVSFLKKIHRIVIIGGCGNGRGNVHRTTEFNITADPEAASIAFNAFAQHNIICTIVSWELTLAHSIPWSLYNTYMNKEMASKSRLNNFLNEICAFSFGNTQKQISIPNADNNNNANHPPGERFSGAVICDMLAMAVALNPSELIKSSEQVNVEIELHGTLTRGQTVVDWGCFDGVNRVKNCDWIMEINDSYLYNMFERIFD